MSQAEPRTYTVAADDDGIRLDRWFKRHMEEVSFNLVSRWARTGQLRLNGEKATPGDRIEAGQQIRLPAADAVPARDSRPQRVIDPLTEDEEAFVREMVIATTADAILLNKPPGLATQGGTNIDKHLDRLLDGLADDEGQRPKLVHRLDKDTSGILLVARSARAAGFFSKSFAGRTARKVYWALVVGDLGQDADGADGRCRGGRGRRAGVAAAGGQEADGGDPESRSADPTKHDPPADPRRFDRVRSEVRALGGGVVLVHVQIAHGVSPRSSTRVGAARGARAHPRHGPETGKVHRRARMFTLPGIGDQTPGDRRHRVAR